MFKIYKALSDLTWNLFGQYRVFIIPLIFFIIATIFYNIGEVVYSNTGGDTVGFFGATSRIMYLLLFIYTIIKTIIACKNQYEQYKQNKLNEKNNNK